MLVHTEAPGRVKVLLTSQRIKAVNLTPKLWSVWPALACVVRISSACPLELSSQRWLLLHGHAARAVPLLSRPPPSRRDERSGHGGYLLPVLSAALVTAMLPGL
eukprot:scaffold323245_cov32-Tisochrysis_lutea.AAC.3